MCHLNAGADTRYEAAYEEELAEEAQFQAEVDAGWEWLLPGIR